MEVSFDHSPNYKTSIPSLEDSFENDVIKTGNSGRQTEINGLVVKFIECQIKKSFQKLKCYLTYLQTMLNSFKYSL